MDIQIKLGELSERLDKIERHLGLHKPEVIHQVSQPSPQPIQNRVNKPKGSGFSSARLLGVVAVICVVLASAFIIKLAIDSGWLTPLRQVGLSGLVGGLLIFGGLSLKNKDLGYASYLPAAGVVVLFLTIFAAHLFYDLIGQHTAVILSGAVSMLCVWLFTVFRSDIFPICAAIGSYAVPVIIGFLWRDFTSIAVYFIGWSATYAILSIFVHSRTLSIISAYLGVGLLGFLALEHKNVSEVSYVAGMQAFQFVILLAGIVFYSLLNNTPLTSGESYFLYPILLFFYSSQYALFDRVHPETAPYIMLTFAAAVAGAYFFVKDKLSNVLASRGLVESYCILTLFHSLYLEILTDELRPLVLAGLLIVSLLVNSGSKQGISSITGLLAVFIIVLREYGSIVIELIDTKGRADGMTWVLYGVLISVLLILKGIWHDRSKKNSNDTLYFILAHSLIVATLYHLFEPHGSLPLSVAWTTYAGVVLGVGFKMRNEALAKSSLAVLFFAVGKVFTYDVQNAAPVIRILCLFLTATVLYGCGWMLRKIEAWERGE